VSILFGLLAAIAVMLGLGYVLARMKTQTAAQTLRVILGIGGVLIGVILTVRGLAAAGLPLIGAALGLLGVALRGGQAPKGRSGGSGEGAAQRRSGAMSRREAAQVLGVAETASESEINKAYRDLMKKVHPDAGGNDALAARVQEAREVLLGKR
jgi:hypothetical protein